MERIYEDDAVVSISRPKNDETPSANGAIVSTEATVKGDSVLTVYLMAIRNTILEVCYLTNVNDKFNVYLVYEVSIKFDTKCNFS